MQVRRKSQKQELRVAKSLEAKTVIASGSMWSMKGDVRNEKFLVECKITEKSYYTLSLNVWEKILKEALKDGIRLPVMSIDVEDGNKQFALFLESHFKNYNRFDEVLPVDSREVSKNSFRVSCPMIIRLISYRYSFPCNFIIIPWCDFLYLIDGGEA